MNIRILIILKSPFILQPCNWFSVKSVKTQAFGFQPGSKSCLWNHFGSNMKAFKRNLGSQFQLGPSVLEDVVGGGDLVSVFSGVCFTAVAGQAKVAFLERLFLPKRYSRVHGSAIQQKCFGPQKLSKIDEKYVRKSTPELVKSRGSTQLAVSCTFLWSGVPPLFPKWCKKVYNGRPQ